jgi:hypothetical protein
MTRDEIIKMSQKAGFDPVTDIGSKFELFELFARLSERGGTNEKR